MENSKVVALVLGCIAALLVIMAGKSCASDIQEQNKKSSGSGYSSVNSTTKPAPKLIEEPPAPAVNNQQAVEQTDAATEPQYEVVTDMLGRVVETIPVTQAEEDIPATEEEPETTLSLLDEYYKQQQENATNELSGYNHGTPEQQHQKELENATFPSDFSINVN